MKTKPKFKIGQVVRLPGKRYGKITAKSWETHFGTFITWEYQFGMAGYSEALLKPLNQREAGR